MGWAHAQETEFFEVQSRGGKKKKSHGILCALGNNSRSYFKALCHSEKKNFFSPVTLKFLQITTAYFHKTVTDWKIKEERAHGDKGLAINPQTV